MLGDRLGIQVGMILGSIAIARGGHIPPASTALLGDSVGAGVVSTPDIIARGIVHGMAHLGDGAVDTGAVDIGDITIIPHLTVIIRVVDPLTGITGGTLTAGVRDLVITGAILADARVGTPLL